jgi:hypothetical protein
VHSAGINAYLHTRVSASSSTHAEETKTSPEQQDLFHYPRSPSPIERVSSGAPTQRMGFSSEMRAHRQWDYFSLSCVHALISLKAFSHLGISAWLYCFRQVPGSLWKNIRGCSENVQRMWLTRVHANREILGRLLKCSTMWDGGIWGGCSKRTKSENSSL